MQLILKISPKISLFILISTIALISCVKQEKNMPILQPDETSIPKEISNDDKLRNNQILSATFEIIFRLGNQEPFFRDGLATNSYFMNPIDLIQDRENIYVADTYNQKIRKIDTNNLVSTVAGNGSSQVEFGVATEVGIGYPHALTIDSMKNIYFLTGNSRINKLSKDGIFSQFLYKPDKDLNGVKFEESIFSDILFDKEDNLYIVDNRNHIILKVFPTGLAINYAGNGKPGYKEGFRTEAQFNNPEGIAINSKGEIFVSDKSNFRIRKIDQNGQVSTFIGNGSEGNLDGKGSKAQIDAVYKLVFDQNDILFFLDPFNNALRKASESGEVTTVLRSPVLESNDNANVFVGFFGGIEIGNSGNVLIADRDSGRIIELNQKLGLQSVAGAGYLGLDGNENELIFPYIYDISVNSKGTIFVSTVSGIKKIDHNNFMTSTFISNQGNKLPKIYKPTSIYINSEDETLIADEIGNKIYKINSDGSFITISDNVVSPIKAIEDDYGNVFILENNRHHILKIDRNKQISRFAGNTNISGDKIGNVNNNEVLFNHPKDLAFDKEGNLLVVDSENGKVKVIDRKGNVSELSGYFKDHLGKYIHSKDTFLAFRQPNSITIDENNAIYVLSIDGINYISKDRVAERIPLTEIFPKLKLVKNFSTYETYHSLVSDQKNNLYLAMSSSLTPQCIEAPQNCDLSETHKVNGSNTILQNKYLIKIKVNKHES